MHDAWLAAGFYCSGARVRVVHDTVWDASPVAQAATAALACARVAIECALPGRRPDVAHLHVSVRGSLYRQLVICVLCRSLRVPVVVHLHSGSFFEWTASSRVATWAASLVTRHASSTVVVAEHWRRHAEALGASTVAVVPHFIPEAILERLARCRPTTVRVPSGDVEVLFYGRWSRVKGVDTLIEAVGLLESPIATRVRLRIYGNGDRAWVERLAKRTSGISVEINGWLHDDEKPSVLGRADVIVAPSRAEGFNQALLEIVAAERPLVATAVGPVPEILATYKLSRLVPPNNPRALAQALRDVIQSSWPQAAATGADETLARFNAGAAREALRCVYAEAVR